MLDQALYIVNHFPNMDIVIAPFDFGEEGGCGRRLALHAGIEKASHSWENQKLFYNLCLEISYINMAISMSKTIGV